jgi:hypothetical protein
LGGIFKLAYNRAARWLVVAHDEIGLPALNADCELAGSPSYGNGVFTSILPPGAKHFYADAGQFGNGADVMERRIYAIQAESNFSVLHFSVETITRWSGICVLKWLGMWEKSWPPVDM